MPRSLILVLMFWSLPSFASNFVLPRVEAPVAIDGDVSDPFWSGALLLDRFYEVSPGDNVDPPVETRAWIAYDAHSLYLAFRAEDPNPEAIRGPYVGRDRVYSDQDFVQIDLDTQGDGKSSTIFRVNPRGIQTDGTYTESTGLDDFAPDFDFDSAARITSSGWEVEMRIPLTSLRYPQRDPQSWRATLLRVYPRNHRYMIQSAPVARGETCYLCNSLQFDGIAGLPDGGVLVVTPYAVSRTSDDEALGSDKQTEGGIDAKWLPGSGVSVDATIRPDFSQVESDSTQLSVNNRFAIFYPEKRPFFMEGADLLSSPIAAIHTRTITAPDWGARLTARPGNHAFTVVVADDRGGGSIIIPGAASSSLAVQPESLALFGRYRYALGSSSAGALFTSRSSGDGKYENLVAGPDLLWWPRPTDRLTAQLLYSSTTENGTSFDDHAAFAEWNHSSAHWGWSAAMRDIGSGFRADSGFVPQNGIRSLNGSARRVTYPSRVFSRVQPEVVFERTEEQNGALVSRNLFPRLTVEGWRGTVGVFEHHRGEKGRAADGSVHAQDYAYGMLRFLLSRRVPYLRIEARYGDELDVEHSRIGHGRTLIVATTMQPLDRLQVELNGETHRLEIGDQELFTANGVRTQTTWTFSSRSFTRAIGEWQTIDWNRELAPGHPAHEGFFNGSLLYGYRLNWQTNLYVGYGDSRLVEEGGGLTEPRTEVFVKLSYALRPGQNMRAKED